MQVWQRSFWQPPLPRTEHSDARAGRSSAIFLLTPPWPERTRSQLEPPSSLVPLSSRLCFFPSGLALLLMAVPLAERKAQAPGCLS